MINLDNMRKINVFDAIRLLKENYIVFDKSCNAYYVINTKIYKKQLNELEWKEIVLTVNSLISTIFYINKDIEVDYSIAIPLEGYIEPKHIVNDKYSNISTFNKFNEIDITIQNFNDLFEEFREMKEMKV